MLTVEKTRYPKFLDDPCVHAPLFDPGGPPSQAITGPVVWSSAKLTTSTPHRTLSRLYHAACTLSVYASQPGSPPDHATLDSRWWPALSGQGFHLLGRVEGFRHVFPSTWLPPSPGFAWRNQSWCTAGWSCSSSAVFDGLNAVVELDSFDDLRDLAETA